MIRANRLLLIVLVVALSVRVWGINFGLPYVNARPDETQIAGPAVGFLGGNLRPPLLEWPTLFPYSVALAYVAYFTVSRPFADYDTLAAFAESRRADISPFLLVTRGLSALMGVMTVFWVFALGKRTFDQTIGVVAASFLAVSFLHVRDSHFGVTDIPMTALVMAAVLAISRWHEEAGLMRAAGAGVVAGLAASTKYNALGVCVPFAVAVVLRFLDERRTIPGAFVRAAQASIVFLFALAVAFFGTSPYVLIDWPRFVASVSATQAMVASGHGMVVGRGWWYYAQVVLPAAVGWPILIGGSLGILVLLIARFRQAAVLLAFPVAYYLVVGRGYGVFARYILPELPFLCIGAAWLMVTGVRTVSREASVEFRRALLVAATILMAAPTAYQTWHLDRLLSQTDNRTIAARTLIGLLPTGSLFYQSGEPYGHAPLVMGDRRADVRIARFDARTGRFSPEDPDWILIQRSPLVLYSDVPPALEAALNDRYILARAFQTGLGSGVSRTFDQQDAFYLPLAGLGGLSRPGPEFQLFSRRRDVAGERPLNPAR